MAPGSSESLMRFCRERLRRASINTEYFLTLSREDQLALIRDWNIPMLYAIAALDPPRTTALVARALNDRFNTWLSQYVPDPETFRSRMRSCNAVISGSAALKFIDPTHDFNPKDIDIYVADHTYDIFTTYLIANLNGKTIHWTDITPNLVGPDDPPYMLLPPYNKRLLGFRERTVIKTPLATFDVLRSRTVTPLSVLAQFQSTHVMNFIAADKLVLAYPRTTLERVGILASGRYMKKFAKKYNERGFMLHESPLDYWGTTFKTICVPEGYCPRDSRVFGDAHSLCLRWDQGTLSEGQPEKDETETAVWVFGGIGCGHWDCIGRIPHRVHTILTDIRSSSSPM